MGAHVTARVRRLRVVGTRPAALARTVPLRLTIAGAFIVMTGSCAWVSGPLDLPSSPTVRGAGLCVPGTIDDPVTGILIGDPGDPRLLWLVDDRGRRLELVWPIGFTVDIRTGSVIDEAGHDVAVVGTRLFLDKVRLGDYEGTADDPYPVGGIVNERCLR